MSSEQNQEIVNVDVQNENNVVNITPANTDEPKKSKKKKVRFEKPKKEDIEKIIPKKEDIEKIIPKKEDIEKIIPKKEDIDKAVTKSKESIDKVLTKERKAGVKNFFSKLGHALKDFFIGKHVLLIAVAVGAVLVLINFLVRIEVAKFIAIVAFLAVMIISFMIYNYKMEKVKMQTLRETNRKNIVDELISQSKENEDNKIENKDITKIISDYFYTE